MDQLLETLSEQNHNPALREDLVHDLWNSELGRDFDSPEHLDSAISAGLDPQVIAAVRSWLGIPAIQ